MDTKRDADIATYGCGPLQPVTRNTDAGGPGQNNVVCAFHFGSIHQQKEANYEKEKGFQNCCCHTPWTVIMALPTVHQYFSRRDVGWRVTARVQPQLILTSICPSLSLLLAL